MISITDNQNAQRNYLLLLLATIGILVFPGIGILFWDDIRLLFNLLYTTIIALGVYTVFISRQSFRTGLILGFFSVLPYWFRLWSGMENSFWVKATEPLFGVAFFLFLYYQMARFVLFQKNVNLQVIYAAVLGYLLIGILGGHFCNLLELMVPGSFQFHDGQYSSYRFIYFSFVTLSTLGYGDITPDNDAARSFVMLILIAGQVYLAIIMAILIGKFIVTK